MSFYPARLATLHQRGDGPLLHRRYTCGLTENDCGNGYCCGTADECVFSNDGQTLCKLPGFSTIQGTATLASDATPSTFASGTRTAGNTGASVRVCSGSGSTDCAVVANGGSISSSSDSSGGGISAGAIAGIFVGIVGGLAIVVGAVVVFLCARRRKRRREVANAGMETKCLGQGQPVYQPVVGGNGGFVDMYAGSNVGKMQGEVPGRAEMMADTVPVRELPGSERVRPVELDAGGPVVEKITEY